MIGGYNTEISFDQYIPLIPIFVVPYLLGIVFWVFSIIFINLKANPKAVRQFNLIFISAGILSVLIYVFVPTFIVRPEIVNSDVFSTILNLVYANDRVYNASPSGHTFYTIICFLNLYKVLPKQRLLWAIISILIISSTVLTKQHNVLDIVFGIIFALGIYFLGKVYSSSIK
jgi:membrane-associated phospholipid phosphatase